MSADNWAICPACLDRATAAKEAQVQNVKNVYGTISIEEFDQLRAESEEPIDERALTTFREDYEFYLDVDPHRVEVRYSGYCTVCGSGVKFADTRAIKIKEPSK